MRQFTLMRIVKDCWKVRGGRASLRDGPMRPSLHTLVFFVLVGFVQGKAAEFVGDLQQVLVALVPIGADFA